MSQEKADLDEAARAILRKNDRDGYTVPTAGLYPFQWNWDSCLVALGWATFDEPRAWQEIETLFSAQWPDGMVPHIVFHRPDPGYFPGPEIWASGRTPPTSGITQPPVAASCVRRMFEQARDRGIAESALSRLFPKLLAWHRWFHAFRDPDRRGVVATVHPWETGMDNSPAWDEPLAAVTIAADLAPYQRRDLSHVDPSQRPTRDEYDRYMTLVELFRRLHYDPAQVVARSPFLVADPCTNFLLLRADRDLLALAEHRRETAAAGEIRAWIERSEKGLESFLREPQTGFWHAFDLRHERRIAQRTHAGFLAGFAGLGDAALETALETWIAKAPFALSSVETDDPKFDRRRYWRGPVWAIANFMIAQGLRSDASASRLHADTRALISGSGFHEYFDPIDGTGLGGTDFCWTAAMWLAWAGKTDARAGSTPAR